MSASYSKLGPRALRGRWSGWSGCAIAYPEGCIMSTVASMPVNTYRDYLAGKPVVLWVGPNQIDPGRMVAVVLTYSTSNRKTGPVHTLAFYDLTVQDGEPVGAGCRMCPLQGVSCYVEVFYDLKTHKIRHSQAGDLPRIPERFWKNFVTHSVRFGSYGDPSTVPAKVIEKIAFLSGWRWMGYTHFWASCDQSLRRFLMASCETWNQVQAAKKLGWRVFYSPIVGTMKDHKNDLKRVLRSARAHVASKGAKNWVVCPAFAVPGKQCMGCAVGCDGKRGKPLDVINPAHGQRLKSHPGDVVPLLPIVD